MGCGCQQSSVEPFSGNGTDYIPADEPTSMGEDSDGYAENQDCYIQRAGDPKQSTKGEPISEDTNSNIVTLVDTIVDDNGSELQTKIGTIAVNNNNMLHAEFILNNPTKTIGLWGYKWLRYTSDKKPNIQAMAMNDNYELILDGTLPSGEFDLQITAYEGRYDGNDYLIQEDEQSNLPIINKQTFSITANLSKDKIIPIVINMPVQGRPKILARYGITFGLKNEDSVEYDRTHTGIDLGIDSNVVASSDGIIVEVVENDPIYGNYILMRHNGFDKIESIYTYTLYANIGSINVKKDKTKIISTGSILGKTGNSGLADTKEKQIHFELRRSPQLVACLSDMQVFQWIDPLSVMNGDFIDEDEHKISIDNSDKSEVLSSKPNETITTNNCDPSNVQYDPANYQNIKIDPSIIKAGSDLENYFISCMQGEIGAFYAKSCHNSQHTINGCPGGNPIPGAASTTAKGKGCGWHSWIKDKGGETKFGVAKNFGNHKTINYNSLNRDAAMQIFHNDYLQKCKGLSVKNKTFGCVYVSQFYQGPKILCKSAKYVINYSGISIDYNNGSILTNQQIEQLNYAVEKLGYDTCINLLFERFFLLASSAARNGKNTRITTVKGHCVSVYKGS